MKEDRIFLNEFIKRMDEAGKFLWYIILCYIIGGAVIGLWTGFVSAEKNLFLFLGYCLAWTLSVFFWSLFQDSLRKKARKASSIIYSIDNLERVERQLPLWREFYAVIYQKRLILMTKEIQEIEDSETKDFYNEAIEFCWQVYHKRNADPIPVLYDEKIALLEDYCLKRRKEIQSKIELIKNLFLNRLAMRKNFLKGALA